MSQKKGKRKIENHSHSSKKQAKVYLDIERHRAEYQRDLKLILCYLIALEAYQVE